MVRSANKSLSVRSLDIDQCLATFVHHTLEYSDLTLYHAHYSQEGNHERAGLYQRLIATADARYDFSQASLNEVVAISPAVDVRPATFAQWLASVWQPTSESGSL